MGTFKHSTPSTASLVSTYKSKVVVYLEGKTDVTLFQNYWFKSKLDKIEFRQPKTGVGCQGVLSGVADYRKSTGLAAFGLIDRDKLHADENWGLVWESDNSLFLESRPYGDHIRVTLRWEIENYLIHSDIIEQYIAHCDEGRVPRPPEVCDEYFLSHAQALIPHAALNTARRQAGLNEWGEGATSSEKSRVEVEGRLESMHSRGEITDDVWANFKINLQKVEHFASGESPSDQMTGLLRRIDGKALMHRLKKAHKIQHDITFHIADAIFRANAVAPELIGYVDEFCQG